MGAWLGHLCPGMGVALCGTPTHCSPGGPGVHSRSPSCPASHPSHPLVWERDLPVSTSGLWGCPLPSRSDTVGAVVGGAVWACSLGCGTLAGWENLCYLEAKHLRGQGAGRGWESLLPGVESYPTHRSLQLDCGRQTTSLGSVLVAGRKTQQIPSGTGRCRASCWSGSWELRLFTVQARNTSTSLLRSQAHGKHCLAKLGKGGVFSVCFWVGWAQVFPSQTSQTIHAFQTYLAPPSSSRRDPS